MNARSDSALYDAVASALDELSSDLVAAESHGMLCGMLCDPEAFDGDAWLRQVIGEDSEWRLVDLPAASPLHLMIRGTLRALQADDFGFMPLLPADDAPLAERTGALGAWCRGFLSGFGLHGAGVQLNDEGREYLRDLYNIGQVANDDDFDEEAERAFVEVVEYTRMGAMMLHEQFRSLLTAPPPRLH
jgi:uncharacterized protein YgfB (UPF0149 family)